MEAGEGRRLIRAAETSFNQPLTIEEVPLPTGYPRSLLEPHVKEAQKAAHRVHVRQVLEKRTRINQRAKEDKGYRQKLYEMCRRDAEFFIDYFVWTYDDRIGVEEPLVLYPFQRQKLVDPYVRMTQTEGRTRMTLCLEKSRGVGFTWVEMALRLWSWIFKDNWSILIGAVHAIDVDDGGQEATHESLFGKLRFMLNQLPWWFREDQFGGLVSSKELNKINYLKHPFKPKNLIVGKQFGDMFGRGHRYSEVFGDEIAHAEAMKNADTSLKQTSNRFSGGSTPKGKGTFHYQLMKGPLRVVRRTIHWSEHPELDLDWYNEQREHMTQEAIAQELDIDYEGSAGRRVLPEVSVATHFLEPPPDLNVTDPMTGRMERDGTLYVPTLPVHAVIDPGISDALACVWIQPDEHNNEWRVIDFVQQQDRSVDWIVPFLLGRIPEETYDNKPWPHTYNAVEKAIIERHGRWDPPKEVFGDDFGNTRSMVTGYSCWDLLANYELFVCGIKVTDDLAAIGYLQLWMRHVRVSGHLNTQRNGPPQTHPTFAEVLSQWRYRRQAENSEVLTLRPVHDVYCHGGDCLKMYAQTVVLPEARQQPIESGSLRAAHGSGLSVPRPYRPRS